MTSKTVVFLGPTLDRHAAADIFDAVYRPPVEQGDIVRTVASAGVDALVIVDGAFATTPAVRHKEILWALSQGIAVYGAASMGALRAAELEPFGMRGHGLVFRWYRATPLADDDEVAVAMMPAELGAAALGEALINMRATLGRAERSGVIDGELRRAMTDRARRLHFPLRSYPTLFEDARSTLAGRFAGPLSRLEAWVADNAVDVKRDDAVSLLRRLAADPPGRSSAPSPSFRLTEAWSADLEECGLVHHVGDPRKEPC